LGRGASQPKKAILARGGQPSAGRQTRPREASPAQGGKPSPGRQAQPRGEASPRSRRLAPAQAGFPEGIPYGFLRFPQGLLRLAMVFFMIF